MIITIFGGEEGAFVFFYTVYKNIQYIYIYTVLYICKEVNMKVISVVAQKGGVGKSTLSTQLSALAVQQGFKVALVDLDTQGSSLKWSGRRGETANLIVVRTDEKRLAELIKKAKKGGFDLIFIDTDPRSNKISLEAAKQSHFSLLPTEPYVSELDALDSTLEIVRSAKTPHAVVINKAPPGGLGNKIIEELKLKKVRVLSQVIRRWVAYPKANDEGKFLSEIAQSDKALVELENLFAILKKGLKISV